MPASTTLILGAGFGGIVCANTLRRLLPSEHRIVLIEKGSAFSFGAAKISVALGEKRPAEIMSPLGALSKRGIELVTADITRIDPVRRSVDTTKGSFQGDHLVVALGADCDMGLIPGLADAAQSFYTLEGAIALRDVMPKITQGRLVILIPRTPFKCPPGPYEGAMLIHDYLQDRQVRSQVRLSIITIENRPMATAGPAIGDFVMAELGKRDIEYLTQKKTASVDPARRVIQMEDGSTESYDMLIAVDPHRVPKVVEDAGLAKQGGWIPVDPKTMAVPSFQSVWAVGDVTTVPLPGRFKPDVPLVLPKAGVMADSQGRVAAHQIAARVLGTPADTTFDGRGYCFLEMGDMHAVKGEGDFFQMPHPNMEPRVPDMIQYEDKQRWMSGWVKENLDRS